MKLKLIIATFLLVTIAGGAWFTAWANTPDRPLTATVQPIQQPEPTPQPPTVDELLRLVNEERAKVGVTPLTVNSDVQRSAQLKAEDMYNNNYFSHIMPSTGKVLNQEMDNLLSANCVDSSENIVDNDKFSNTASGAVSAWKNSPPHYQAMIDGQYTQTGFGVAGDKIVQHFCIAR
ncbi:CAP domain-containing protein [Candidatus Saccharibacteria bacterium]|nr:CAP domain-containing protein [Candidatus Saccharibacteria bacterium]